MQELFNFEGKASFYPFSYDYAVINSYVYYTSLNLCMTCNHKDYTLRYVETHDCVKCIHTEIYETVSLCDQGWPGRPDPYPRTKLEALTAGVTFYFPRDQHICEFGPHRRVTSTITGRCAQCEETKRALTVGVKPMTQAEALRLGLKIYTAHAPCKMGHPAQRYAANGNCVSCQRGAFTVVDTRAARAQQPTATTRDEARAKGLKRWWSTTPCKREHIGWRYTSTGGCIACLTDKAPIAPPPTTATTREGAKAAGLKTYTSGAQCKRGHMGPRYTSTGNCIECMRGA